MSSLRDDTVAGWIRERGPIPKFSPTSEYDPAGDCIEFFVMNEPFYRKRLDGWVTAYYGEQSGEVVGGLIKGVKTSLLTRFPGLTIDIEGGAIRIVILLRASALQADDPVKQVAYKAVINKAEELDFRAQLCPA